MMVDQISIFRTSDKFDAYKAIYSTDDWFKDAEYLVVKDDGYKLTITKCYLDIPKNAYKFNQQSHQIKCYIDIPFGVYDFDEESNEDELIIYYNE